MSTTTQDHIHLSTTLGSAPENAPSMKWLVTERFPIPVVIQTVDRSLTGVLKPQQLIRSGNVVRLTDYRYTIKVNDDFSQTCEQRLEALQAMHGAVVYLVDNWHVADGVDHTPHVRTMYLEQMNEPQAINPLHRHFYVTIELRDNTLGDI